LKQAFRLEPHSDTIRQNLRNVGANYAMEKLMSGSLMEADRIFEEIKQLVGDE
jgi:hypothetical protein